jgi:hypothetical protein
MTFIRESHALTQIASYRPRHNYKTVSSLAEILIRDAGDETRGRNAICGVLQLQSDELLEA